MKKFLSIFMSLTMCISLLTVSACKETPVMPTSSGVTESLELENSHMLLTLGDKKELSAFYNRLDGENLAWSSSAPDVVSVDENGVTEALSVGKATITARYGSKMDSCQIEVGLSGNVPVLVFGNNMPEEITLLKGTGFGFGTNVQFNGKTFDDADVKYFVSDESIGSVIDGKFVANNVAGSTDVSVFATWRGQTVRAKTVKVNVIAESTVLLNQGKITDFHLYTTAEHEGKNYATTQTISSVFISEDGEEITDYELSVLDEGVASIEKADNQWNITANKAGNTKLIVSYSNREFPFEIVVERPVANTNKTVSYSLTDAKYFDERSETQKPLNGMIAGFEDIVSYTFGGKEYKLKDGVFAFSEGEGQEVTLYNESVGYKVIFDVYTTVIDELKDFENIYAGEVKTEISGMYMLGKDIIEPNTVLTMPSGKVPNDFAGEFDGKGHVLSFTFDHGSEHRFGLFGEYLNGARIENFALSNVKQSGTTRKNPSGIICFAAQPNNSTKASTVKNVYVDIEFFAEGKANIAFMYSAAWAAIIENVIIHVPTVPLSDEYGSFARGACASVSNSYIISEAKRYSDLETNPNNINGWIRMQPVLYANYNEMKAAGNDYVSFSSEYWDVTTHGIPVWKTLENHFVD